MGDRLPEGGITALHHDQDRYAYHRAACPDRPRYLGMVSQRLT